MKRFISIALMFIFLSSVFLTACDDKTDSNSDISGTVSTIEGKYVADIPQNLNYGGRTFTFLTCGVNAEHESEIVYNDYSDGGVENMSSVVNEAIAQRNDLVEQNLNIEIKELYIHDGKRLNGLFASTIRNNYAAGTGDYFVVVPCIYDAANLAATGYLYD